MQAELCGTRNGDFVCDWPKGHENAEKPLSPDWAEYHHHTLPSPSSGYLAGCATAAEWLISGAAGELTLAQFRAHYRDLQFGATKRARVWSAISRGQWMRLAFELRIRTADRCGYLDNGRWCWPWRWAQLYHAARFPDVAR